jgi:hypothetical protein
MRLTVLVLAHRRQDAVLGEGVRGEKALEDVRRLRAEAQPQCSLCAGGERERRRPAHHDSNLGGQQRHMNMNIHLSAVARCCGSLLWLSAVAGPSLRSLWLSAVALCCGPLLWQDPHSVRCGSLLWRSGVALCCGRTLTPFAVALCCGALLWRSAVAGPSLRSLWLSAVALCCGALLWQAPQFEWSVAYDPRSSSRTSSVGSHGV